MAKLAARRVLLLILLALWIGDGPATAQGVKLVPLAVERAAFTFGLESSFSFSPVAKQHFWRISVPNTTDADFEAMLLNGMQPPPIPGNILDLDPNPGAVATEIQRMVNNLIAQAQADPLYQQDDILNPHAGNPRVIQLAMVAPVAGSDMSIPLSSQMIGYASLWLTGADQHELRGYFIPPNTSLDSTPPTTSTSLMPAPNAAGWNNSSMTVTLAATDNDGGVGVGMITYSATGAQPIASSTISGSSGTVTITAEGTTTLTYAARDRSNNVEATKTLTIRIDKTPPSVVCPAPTTVGNASGQCSAAVRPAGAAATDNVGVVSLTSNPSGDSLFPLGLSTITWTALDAAGNQATCNQSVMVKDVEAPALTCPVNITQPRDKGKKFASVTIKPAIATDSCGPATVVGTRDDGQPISAPYPLGKTAIQWLAMDAAGNRAACIQTVTVTK
ncbi:MAG TPA: HYR domain-containing protein [Gemmatimonadales bacterium]|nr:HYR domain-containing protein [Gemmatimonadales bacterium]